MSGDWTTHLVHYDHDGRARCGQRNPQLLAAPGETVTCMRCLNIITGVNTGGIQPPDLKPCGTPAAYRRHLRRHGKPVRCEACLQGERRRGQDSRKDLRRAA